MPKLTFRGAFIRYVDLRYDEDAAMSHVRLEMTADFSDVVAKEMNWNPMSFVEDLPVEVQAIIADHIKNHGGPTKWMELAGLTTANLKGRIAATSMELIPNGELKRNAISLDANEVRNFKCFRVETKEGTTKSLELRFQVVLTSRGAAGMIESYLDTVGIGAAQLKVGFARQEDLDLNATAKPEEAEESGERLISKAQADDTAEEADEVDRGATLAPAVLVGGSHQKGTRGRRPRDPQREAIADGTEPLPEDEAQPVVN